MPRVGEALTLLVFAPHVSGMGVHASSLGSGHYNKALCQNMETWPSFRLHENFKWPYLFTEETRYPFLWSGLPRPSFHPLGTLPARVMCGRCVMLSHSDRETQTHMLFTTTHSRLIGACYLECG